MFICDDVIIERKLYSSSSSSFIISLSCSMYLCLFSLFFVPIVISTKEKKPEREREKERNVEEENTIRLLADSFARWMATRRRRGRKEASTDYSCFSLSLSLFFLKQRLYTNEPGRREYEKAPFVDLSHRTHTSIHIEKKLLDRNGLCRQ